MNEFFEYFHTGYVGKVIFVTTSLDLSFDGKVSTFLNHLPGLAEIEGYLLWVFFFPESYVIFT